MSRQANVPARSTKRLVLCHSSADPSPLQIGQGYMRDARVGVLGGGQLGRMMALAAVCARSHLCCTSSECGNQNHELKLHIDLLQTDALTFFRARQVGCAQYRLSRSNRL